MPLILNQTPEKQVGNYDSKVVFANPLPIIFEIDSDTAPVNLQNYATFSIAAHTNINGYAQIEVLASATGINCGDFITIDSNLYAGTYKVLRVVSSTFFQLEVSYNTATTPISGTVKRFYNNYYVEAKIYAGIPVGHFYYNDNPMREIATIRNTPLYIESESANRAYIDVSGAVRSAFLPIENDVCGQVRDNPFFYYFNDRKAWVAFYIEYREVYDSGSSDCEVTQTFGEWETSETYYAINGTSQFQYKYGGNAGEYVMNDVTPSLPVKFLTTLDSPYLWEGKEFDIAFFVPKEAFFPPFPDFPTYSIWTTTPNGSDNATFLSNLGEGVYRFELSRYLKDVILPAYPSENISYLDVTLRIFPTIISTPKTVKIIRDCVQYEGKHVTYLNSLGGWDYIFFGAGQDTKFDNTDTQQVERNIFDAWDSYFTGGTTQLDNVRRITRKEGVIRSYPLSKELFRQYCEQLSITVKMQEIKDLQSGESCSEVQTRKTILPQNQLSYSDTNKDYVINLEYQETNETLSQWQ